MPKHKDFTIKGLKTFTGMEGYGFNASLYYKGKKIAFVIDSAQGGCYDYQWADYDAQRVDINTRTWEGKPRTYKGTPYEKVLTEYSASLPPEQVEGMTLHPDNDTVVNDLVAEVEENREFKRKCKKKTLILTTDCSENSYIEFKYPYGAGIKAHIEKKYGDKLVEIINERYL